MRTLDHLLYAWIAESDERRFERGFEAYFLVAFPAVVRYLAQLSHWTAEQLEDIAQEALLQFFDRVGRGRRHAAQVTAQALARIGPLGLGALHERQVIRWTGAVSAFRSEWPAFQLSVSGSRGEDCATAVRSLARRVPELQADGYRLLQSVRFALHAQGPDTRDETVSPGDREARDCAQRFAAEMAGEGPAAHAAEGRLPGVRQFTMDVHALIEVIPRLQAPTNGFLFEIAASKYLDESRRRGRLKRGGSGKPAASGRDDAYRHPLEVLSFDTDEQDDEGQANSRLATSVYDPALSRSTIAATDPAHRCESQDFLEQFCAYLRQPLERAAEACEAAQLSGRWIPDLERRRLESLTDKFARTMSVLSLLGEGYSQEQTAGQLGLTRNQVKYIIETVQAAYTRFVTDSLTPVTSSLIGKDARVR